MTSTGLVTLQCLLNKYVERSCGSVVNDGDSSRYRRRISTMRKAATSDDAGF
jgi:hypothetical protein